MYILEAIGTVFFLVIIPLFLMLSLITALVSVIRQTRLGKAQADRDEARQYAHKLWRENEALRRDLACSDPNKARIFRFKPILYTDEEAPDRD